MIRPGPDKLHSIEVISLVPTSNRALELPTIALHGGDGSILRQIISVMNQTEDSIFNQTSIKNVLNSK